MQTFWAVAYVITSISYTTLTNHLPHYGQTYTNNRKVRCHLRTYQNPRPAREVPPGRQVVTVCLSSTQQTTVRMDCPPLSCGTLIQ
jgi:hypothetical protein